LLPLLCQATAVCYTAPLKPISASQVLTMVTYVKLVLMAVFWGGTFIAGRVIARDVQPFSAAFTRFLIATALLLLLTWRVEGKLPGIKREHIMPIILLGMTGVVGYNVFFFNGLQTVSAGRASVIVATNPIFITLLAALFFKEKLSPIKGGGILISVTGAVIVISRGSPGAVFTGTLGWGELLIFGCVLSWVAYSLIGKAVVAELTPLIAVAYSAVAGTLALLLPAYLEGVTRDFVHYPASSWLGLFYLALFGTVLAFQWYYQGIKELGPAKASIFINFVPISGVLLAFIVLGEPLTPSLLLGAILVSTGVYVTNTASLGWRAQRSLS
jgi:drug/metabolite transporter (DMT)-like permease